MSHRHNLIGIKQVIRWAWMQKTVNLLLAGMEADTIRQELHEYLSCSNTTGSEGTRSEQTQTFAVGNLMNIWVSPEQALVPFRNELLLLLGKDSATDLAAHWAMISAAYPFWFNVALQVGRLLNLQNQVSTAQIRMRLKEQYGDRETITRNSRYVIRSFVDWGVLKDTEGKGWYQKGNPINLSDQTATSVLIESVLLAMPEGKSMLGGIMSTPALFPFKLPFINGSYISEHSKRVEVIRSGLSDEMLKLINTAT